MQGVVDARREGSGGTVIRAEKNRRSRTDARWWQKNSVHHIRKRHDFVRKGSGRWPVPGQERRTRLSCACIFYGILCFGYVIAIRDFCPPPFRSPCLSSTISYRKISAVVGVHSSVVSDVRAACRVSFSICSFFCRNLGRKKCTAFWIA